MTATESVRVNVERLQEYNALLIAENTALKARAFLLSRTIASALAHWPLELPPTLDLVTPNPERESWTEKSKRMQGFRSLVLRVTLQLIKRDQAAVPHNAIVAEFKRRYPSTARGTGDIGETVSRRIRELVEDGALVATDVPDAHGKAVRHFFIGPKVADGTYAPQEATP